MDEELLRLRGEAHGLGWEFAAAWAAYTDAHNGGQPAGIVADAAAQCCEVGARYGAALDALLAHVEGFGGEGRAEEADRVRRFQAALAKELEIVGRE